MDTGVDPVPDNPESISNPSSIKLAPTYLPTLRQRHELALLSVPTFYELQASGRNMVDTINSLPQPERKKSRHNMKNIATEVELVAEKNSIRATTSNNIGIGVGGGLLTASLAVLATSAISLPLIILIGAGAAVLGVGATSGHILSSRANDQNHHAKLIRNMIEEIEV
jgi:hypothetical protein